jgi:O-antigen/teichoic acid export membrane protein
MKHTIIYSAIRAVNGTIGLLSIYVLTHVLSPHTYGTFALLVALITFASGVTYQWLSIATSRLVIEHKTTLPSFFQAVIYLFIISSVATAVIVLLSTYIYPDITQNLYWVLLLISVILGLYNLLIQLANIVQKPLIYGILTSSRAVFSLTASIIFILYFQWNAIGAILGFGFGFLVSILLFLYHYKATLSSLYRNILQQPYNRKYRHLASTLFQYGMPLTFTYLAVMLINASDRFMLGKMGTTTDVASYAATYDLTQQTIGVLMNTLFLAYFPKIIHAYYNEHKQDVTRMMQQLGTLMLAIGLLSGLVFSYAAYGISNLMFGKELSYFTAGIMPIIAISMVIGFYKNYFLDVTFQVMKHTKMQFKLTASITGLNIVSNLVLIPHYGATGAAYSSLLAFIVGAILSYMYGKKIMSIPLLSKDTFKVSLAGILVIIINYYGPFNYTNILYTLVSIGTITCLYLALLIVFNTLNSRRKIYNWLKN